MSSYKYRFSVAPMLDWTNKHCRYFHRQFSKYTLLYTEMVTTGAILHAKYDLLSYNKAEHPVALQLGGGDPHDLAKCAKIAEKLGYNQINLNVGCPSDRVQNGSFGACLMAQKELVANCVLAMRQNVNIPITVKTRIGIDDLDSYQFLVDFIGYIASNSGCQEFIIHARKAWLTGLSPKQNREIPPLNYQRVYKLKQDLPDLTIIINGGIKTIEDIKTHLRYVDGIMIGREAYQNPSILGYIDQAMFDINADIITPQQAIQGMYPYIENQLNQGVYLHHIAKPLINAFHNCKGAKQWRRYLSEHAHLPHAGLDVIKSALNFLTE